MSANTITTEAVAVNRFAEYGVQINDYNLDGEHMDLQDLLVKLSSNRATAIEQEVTPLSLRIRKRNQFLEDLGNALAFLSKLQARFDDEDGGDETTSFAPTDSDGAGEVTVDVLRRLGVSLNEGNSSYTFRKDSIEEYVQKVKTKIDGLNNDAQLDMNRLQSLVDRRDQSYETATELMSSVSDTRSKTIGNM